LIQRIVVTVNAECAFTSVMNEDTKGCFFLNDGFVLKLRATWPASPPQILSLRISLVINLELLTEVDLCLLIDDTCKGT